MYPKANNALAKKLNILSLIISVVVLTLVGIMRRVKFDLGFDFSFLPLLYSIADREKSRKKAKLDVYSLINQKNIISSSIFS